MYCDFLQMLCAKLSSDVLKLHFMLHCTLFRVNPCMTCGGQFPEKPYEANLPDHYPRDEFTMLPKFLPRRKDFKNAPYAKVRVCKQEIEIRVEYNTTTSMSTVKSVMFISYLSSKTL